MLNQDAGNFYISPVNLDTSHFSTPQNCPHFRARTILLMLTGLKGIFGSLLLVKQNSRAASSHMATHTPYRMAVSVKQRGRSTASCTEQLEPSGGEGGSWGWGGGGWRGGGSGGGEGKGEESKHKASKCKNITALVT